MRPPLPLPQRKPAANIARIPDVITLSGDRKLLPERPGENANSVRGRKIHTFAHHPTDNRILRG